MGDMADVGPQSDLGRRIRERRVELGLSVEKAAGQAAIDPGYLSYLETSAAPDPTRGTLLRLAAALETSPVALLGGAQAARSGHGVERPTANLVELDRARCLELIGLGGIGRVVFVDVRGPVALPVSYAVVDGDIVFRTERSTSIALGSQGHHISFEVDHIDDRFEKGWSVLVSGTGRPVEHSGELERALPARAGASSERENYVRLVPELITGRQLQHEQGRA